MPATHPLTMFHDRTYSLLGAVPPSEILPIPKHVPASLWEWYSLPDAIAVASRQDHLRPLNELEIWREGEHHFLVFMDENQGVCRWAVELDDGDDPQVLVSVEQGPFLPYADTFSDHIFCAVWDQPNNWGFAAGAQARPLIEDDLVALGGALQPLTRTWNWPPATKTYRFAAAGLRLQLCSGPDQCDWYFFSDSEEAFLRAATLALPRSNLRESLYGLDERSESILTQLRT